jgi:hypothetical protein
METENYPKNASDKLLAVPLPLLEFNLAQDCSGRHAKA